MKKSMLTVLLSGILLSLSGQEKKQTYRFEMELDPIAYGLKGYSVHGILVKNRFRADLGVFGIAPPEGWGGNNGFEAKIQGVGVKVNALLNEKETWFSGLGFGVANHRVTEKESGEKQTATVASLGVHIGYRWFLFRGSETMWKGLYLTPWFSVDYNKTLVATKFNGTNYKQSTFSIFPTVHIGYRF